MKSLLALLTVLSMSLWMSTVVAQRTTVNVVNGHPSVFLWVRHLSETFIPTVNAALEGSGYDIEWNEFYGGSLAPVGGELEALEAGLADVGVVPTVFEPSNLPLQNVTYVSPFGSPDPSLVAAVLNELHDTIPAMRASYERFDLVYLGAGFSLDNYFLMTTFPVESLADLQGRKIGAPGPAVNWLDGTGAVGVSGNLTTYYNDIQTGVYDGTIVFATSAAPSRLYEVAPHVTLIDFGAQYAGSIVANRSWFESQPPEIRAALEAGADAYGTAFSQALIADTEAALQTMGEAGAIISEAPAGLREAWAAALPNVSRQWARELDARGLPGSEVLSAFMQGLRDAGVDLPRQWDLE